MDRSAPASSPISVIGQRLLRELFGILAKGQAEHGSFRLWLEPWNATVYAVEGALAS
jgi:hypothetical protein